MEESHGRSSGGMRQQGVTVDGWEGRPLVSVITAVYNGERYLSRCIESVLGQSYPHVEHLIFDGASKDGTLDILRLYDDRVALWVSEPDSGIYEAWNKALGHARGEWICFLGSDDTFGPNAVSSYMTLAKQHPEAEYLSSLVQVYHNTGYVRTLGSAWNWKTFSRTMCTPHVGSMHKRSLYERIGTYDLSYQIVADYELLLRAGRELRTAYIDEITANVQAGGVSTTRRSLEEQARAKAKTGGRNKVLSQLEMYLQKGKTLLHPPVRYALGMSMTRRILRPIKDHIV